jgi:rubredoxin
MTEQKEEVLFLHEFELHSAIVETNRAMAACVEHLNRERANDIPNLETIGKIDKMKEDLEKFNGDLNAKLKERFNVIPFSECPTEEIKKGEEPPPPPEGMEYFWTWHNRMERLAAMVQHELMICSACPFYFPSKEGSIPCQVYPGTLMSLIPNNFTCAMVQFEHWSRNELHEKIKEKSAKRKIGTYLYIHKDDIDKLGDETKEEYILKLTRKAGEEGLLSWRARQEALRVVSAHLGRQRGMEQVRHVQKETTVDSAGRN